MVSFVWIDSIQFQLCIWWLFVSFLCCVTKVAALIVLKKLATNISHFMFCSSLACTLVHSQKNTKKTHSSSWWIAWFPTSSVCHILQNVNDNLVASNNSMRFFCPSVPLTVYSWISENSSVLVTYLFRADEFLFILWGS